MNAGNNNRFTIFKPFSVNICLKDLLKWYKVHHRGAKLMKAAISDKFNDEGSHFEQTESLPSLALPPRVDYAQIRSI